MIKRLNDQMAIHLKNLNYDALTTDYALPTDLVTLLESPIVECNGCFLLSSCRDSAPEGMNDFDKTVYEDFENHFHPDAYLERDAQADIEYLKLGLESAKRLAARLKQIQSTRFTVCLVYSETEREGDIVAVYGSSTVRFYALRPGVKMGVDDLNSYESEAVLEMDA
ncbi:hypothetical protein [Chryseolinea lacunae]|uniref:Uncharacterized protein n=1 Tax=Chryseolinea lacunae TaxID=2801331 RepID=A0ABS1KZ65_9BACT|nr:hypothetical protein [Chryseolinea lacunae]MBL0744746.1 hypothetical protein [Chryseolinea lacunae]